MEEGLVATSVQALVALREQLALRALRIGLALGSVLGILATVLAVLDPGSRPLAHLLLTALLAAAWIAALLKTTTVAAWLRRAPAAVVVVALLSIVPLTLDGGYHSGLLMELWPLSAIAALVARPRTALACGAASGAAYLVAVALNGFSLGQLVATGHVYDLVTNASNGVFTASVFIVLVEAFRAATRDGAQRLAAVRAGAPAATPALARLIRGQPAPPQLPARNPTGDPLTPAERRIVAALAEGRTAKQIAYDTGRSLHTIRTQIKSAKRKTGARTLEELVLLAPTHE